MSLIDYVILHKISTSTDAIYAHPVYNKRWRVLKFKPSNVMRKVTLSFDGIATEVSK